ncbi:MAG: hypothetical protein JEZ07_14975 [Phycisphaerae bacterium]|nr:hypothetical protein [Phycisphaerae bacterium]
MQTKPEKEYRAGQIKTSIWAKTNNNSRIYSVTIQKSYQDKNNNWKHSTTFFKDDIPKLQLVLTKAYEYITLKK